MIREKKAVLGDSGQRGCRMGDEEEKKREGVEMQCEDQACDDEPMQMRDGADRDRADQVEHIIH